MWCCCRIQVGGGGGFTVYKFQAAIVASACHSHWWGEGGSSEGWATVEAVRLVLIFEGILHI